MLNQNYISGVNGTKASKAIFSPSKLHTASIFTLEKMGTFWNYKNIPVESICRGELFTKKDHPYRMCFVDSNAELVYIMREECSNWCQIMMGIKCRKSGHVCK